MDAESVTESEQPGDAPAGEAPAGDGPELERLRRRVAELERANADLRRANLRLARDRIGPLDSAAASQLGRAPARPRAGARVSGRVKSGLRALALRLLR
jgi:hypothetical protein